VAGPKDVQQAQRSQSGTRFDVVRADAQKITWKQLRRQKSDLPAFNIRKHDGQLVKQHCQSSTTFQTAAVLNIENQLIKQLCSTQTNGNGSHHLFINVTILLSNATHTPALAHSP
jgi:hypothetical protein